MIDWYGPFVSVADAKKACREWGGGEVLYLATGKRRYQRSTGLQYVGISTDANSRFNDKNHKISIEVTRGLNVWIGYVVSHGIAGRREAGAVVAHSRAVEQAERMLAYLMRMPLNEKKRRRPPRESSILVNRWFNAKTEVRRSHRGHLDWPDYLDFDRENGSASLAWFGQIRREKFSEAEILDLARASREQ